MEIVLIKIKDYIRTIDALGGSIKIVSVSLDGRTFSIQCDRFDLRSLIRAGISYRYN